MPIAYLFIFVLRVPDQSSLVVCQITEPLVIGSQILAYNIYKPKYQGESKMRVLIKETRGNVNHVHLVIQNSSISGGTESSC